MTVRTLHPFRDHALIDGAWIAATGQGSPVHDPATGDVIATVPHLGREDTERAIAAAERALVDWRARPAMERADILMRWYALMHDHRDALAQQGLAQAVAAERAPHEHALDRVGEGHGRQQ